MVDGDKMENAVGIKIDYLKNRDNPEQVFSAMALYISAYKQYGQLIAQASNDNIEYELRLQDIEKGSIKALLGSIGNGFGSFITKMSSDLMNDLVEIEEIILPEQVDDLAKKQERRMEENTGNISFYINRVEFAKVLKNLSAANELLYKDEKAEIESINPNDNNIVHINTRMRFLGDPDTMFNIKNPMFYHGRDCLDIIKPVNFGDSQWQVRSRTTNRTFMASIMHKEWLRAYQNGEIPLITARYCMIAKIYYEVDQKNKKSPVKNALIVEVLKVVPSNEDQDALL
ncbi:hypothetical protein ACF2G4_14555 [Pantoea sp. C3]|uniref:hypothetical protein n=1 Tax=Pantoea phytostimulans TaxID=2769024 RepID=UPI0038F66363